MGTFQGFHFTLPLMWLEVAMQEKVQLTTGSFWPTWILQSSCNCCLKKQVSPSHAIEGERFSKVGLHQILCSLIGQVANTAPLICQECSLSEVAPCHQKTPSQTYVKDKEVMLRRERTCRLHLWPALVPKVLYRDEVLITDYLTLASSADHLWTMECPCI